MPMPHGFNIGGWNAVNAFPKCDSSCIARHKMRFYTSYNRKSLAVFNFLRVNVSAHLFVSSKNNRKPILWAICKSSAFVHKNEAPVFKNCESVHIAAAKIFRPFFFKSDIIQIWIAASLIVTHGKLEIYNHPSDSFLVIRRLAAVVEVFMYCSAISGCSFLSRAVSMILFSVAPT